MIDAILLTLGVLAIFWYAVNIDWLDSPMPAGRLLRLLFGDPAADETACPPGAEEYHGPLPYRPKGVEILKVCRVGENQFHFHIDSSSESSR